MTVPYIAVLADDLTGASDCAVQFVQAGWGTQLSLHGAQQQLQAQAEGQAVDVLALTTRSRALAPEQAAQRVAQEVQLLRGAGCQRLYKKVDSTLRGAFRAEIEAAREAWSADAIAVVCPAFPAMGRTLRNGVLYVHGVPVTQTSAATDPVTPVTQDHVPTLLQCALVSPLPEDDAPTLARRIEEAGQVVVVDAQTDADLQRLADALALLGERALPVGAGGLAQPLAQVWRRAQARKPVLTIVTSQHSAARGQAEQVRASGAPFWTPSLEQMASEALWQAWCEALDQEVQAHGDAGTWLLQAPAGRLEGLDADRVAVRLAQAAAGMIDRGAVLGVVVTGGDGAIALLEALGAHGIRLLGEVAPGVPMGVLTGGQAPQLPIVTKAGGFGEPDVLLNAAQAIANRRFEK
jgi:uncharacterized protein YgbK (DUF1537 family)